MLISASYIFESVGSILRVTTADPYASGKTSQFLGICIQRSGRGLGATFILRNTIEGQGRLLPILLIFWKMSPQDSFLFPAPGIGHLQLEIARGLRGMTRTPWPKNGLKIEVAD